MDTLIARNFVRPFLFENLPVRGAIVRLREVWQQFQEGRGYPPPVVRMLGEMTAVTALIAANLKQPGRLTFQLRGEGPVDLLVLDCDERLAMRGMAHTRGDVAAVGVQDLLGRGQLALTLDVRGLDAPYQSLVPLSGDDIAGLFEHYLERSEQQPARLFLHATEEASAGLFLQRLPGAGPSADDDDWHRLQVLAATLRPDELLFLPVVELLHRLFSEDDIRLFDPRPLTYDCPEDRGKVERLLLALGQDECEAVLREKGLIEVHDDICNRTYEFDAASVGALFAGNRPPSR